MTLLDQLNADLKTAMKARDKQTLTVIRSLKSAVMNEQIDLGHDLTDDEGVTVVARGLKQRRESLAEFEKADRAELVADTKAEIAIVERYMPAQMSADKIAAVVKETADQVGATSKADFGKLMGAVMPKIKGKADGNMVNQAVKALLS
ncbi:GatB/YqeY domain-containing protein [Furfurilactobacillus entadae]|uniref:GatB/YqeY domain-containing protein n=1 Tax=Furfurilactobacillus entadae TaxID=2922307 RepID=UPI0035F099C7